MNATVNRNQSQNAFGIIELVSNKLVLSIDYSQSFNEMVGVGKYNKVSTNVIEKYFPINGKGCKEYEFSTLYIGDEVSYEFVTDLLKKEDEKNPWEPARIEHLLAYGKVFPEKLTGRKLAAVGSVGQFDHGFHFRVPCISYNKDDQNYRLSAKVLHEGHVLSKEYYFLAIRRVDPTLNS